MKLKTTALLLMFFVLSLNAQNYKFGNVSKEELKEQFYSKDSSAAAAILYRNVNVHYNYVQATGFQVIKEVHERVKIYNKKGFEYATISENLYQGNGESESFSSLKAYTYNLVDGKIVKSKLKTSDTFKEELSKYYDQEKFTMPDIKEGCIVEYKYKVYSPYTYSIDEIALQYDIPIRKEEISLAIPEYYSFKTNMKGYLDVIPTKSTKNGRISFNAATKSSGFGLQGTAQTKYRNSSVDYITNITTYDLHEVPALVEEPFTNNMDNYRSSVNYEIQYVKFPNSPVKSYATTWEAVSKTIYENENFGDQLTYSKYFKDDLESIMAKANTPEETITSIFSFVQKRMNWNSYVGKYADEGVKDAYKKKSGSVADINLILVAMLREAGLEANPVLVSTRNNGIPLFPTREGFNYVIAAVELDGQNILMDACNKYSEPNLLPTTTLNWFGRIIQKDGSSTPISVMPKKMSKKTTFLNVNLHENGNISGKQRERYFAYNAFLFRTKYNTVSEEDYLDKKENDTNGMEISNYKVKNKKALGKPIEESFDFELESQADVIGDKIYVSPLFFHTDKENPFKQDDRKHPVDFVYPWAEKYMVNISIPEGYEAISIPEDANISLPDQMGSFKYIIANNMNVLQVMAEVKINQAIFPLTDYEAIKELFKNIVEKEAQQIVLSKI